MPYQIIKIGIEQSSIVLDTSLLISFTKTYTIFIISVQTHTIETAMTIKEESKLGRDEENLADQFGCGQTIRRGQVYDRKTRGCWRHLLPSLVSSSSIC